MMLFFIIQGIFFMGANFAHAVTPAFFMELELDDYMFGVALGSMLVVNFCVSPFWGKFIDYISSKVAMLIGSLGYALGQGFFMLSTTEAQIIIARMFTGIFAAASFVALLTYIVNTVKDEKKRAYYMTVSATLSSICASFGFLIGGLLGEISISTAITVQVITIASCGVLFFIVCEKDAKIDIKEVKMGVVFRASNPLSAFLASRQFMTMALLMLFLVVISQSVGSTAFDQSFNYYLRNQFNFTTGYNGVIRGAMGIVTLIVNGTITFWIINRTDMRKSIIYVFALASVMMFLTILAAENPMKFVAANVAVFACTAVSLPLIQNMVARNAAGENSNLVMGFLNSMRALGGIIGAFLAGLLYDIVPIYPFVLGLLAYLCACLFSWIYYNKSKTILD